MSPQLHKFLSEWLAWAEAGGGLTYTFRNNSGLCRNLRMWSRGDYFVSLEFQELRKLLTKDFGEDNKYYPFNPLETQYVIECNNQICHKNKARLAWVRKQIRKWEKAERTRNL